MRILSLGLVPSPFILAAAASGSADREGPQSTPAAVTLTDAVAAETLEGDRKLICHTNNAAECYPKIFQATKDFQKVHPDQDLPSGLHIRLNIYTGEKEAKLNDPSEESPALAGLPVDQAVVLIDPEPPSENRILPGAPAYDPVGKVKEPRGPDSREFHDALVAVRKGRFQDEKRNEGGDGPALDGALDTVEELSHDMYYGLKLTEDVEALGCLFCLMSSEDVFFRGVADSVVPRARRAASAIAGAVQNNPAALRQLETNWPSLVELKCPSGGASVPLGKLIFSTIMPDRESVVITGRDPGPSLVKAKLSVVSGIIRSPEICRYFLEHDGMRDVLRVLLVKDDQYAGAQAKAANLVMDNFLDEDMGATVGLWPQGTASAIALCETDDGSSSLSPGCWDYHVAKLAQEKKADATHWSVALWSMLRKRRQVRAGDDWGKLRSPHDEL